MYYQSGSMRDINNDFTPVKNTMAFDRQNQFQYAQRSKYDKSEASYVQHQKTKVIYQQDKSHRMLKTSADKQQCYYVPITIKSPDRQEYSHIFKVQVTTVNQKNNSSTNMHITNDQDSLFLWSFYIRQSQFHNLKNQQSLKIDFHGFPELIQQYFGCCDKAQAQSGQNKGPQFYAVLNIKKGSDEAQFKILQLNKFKQSEHLSLKFKKANDEQAKKFLSQKYDKQKKQKDMISCQLRQAQNKLCLRMQELQKIHCEYAKMEKQKDQKINQLQRREKQKIKQLTLRIEQQNMKKLKNQNQRSTRNINELNQKIQQLRSKNQELISSLQKANQKIINLQGSQTTLKSKCSILQQQCQGYEKSNKQLKAKQLKHNEQYHLLRNENTKLTCTIQSLQDKLKQKDQRLNQNIEAKSNNFNQIGTLQENLRQQKLKVAKLQQKNQNLDSQITKLQTKIEELINKYQKKKDKFNDYKLITTKQQQKISGLQKQISKISQLYESAVRQKESLLKQSKSKQIKIGDLKKHIEENIQYIEDQKKIISDLNKRLNQKSISSIGLKNLPMSNPLPTYVGFSSTNIGRDFSSTLSSTSESRIKYSPSPISTSPLNQKLTQKITPPFRKYRQGIQNDKDQQNSHSFHSHSRSPIVNKLNQQLDPEQSDRTKQKIGPIKFKKQK